MKTYDDLNESEKLHWLETALHHLTEAVVLTDRQARILHVNAAWERMTGWRRDEVLGKLARDFTPRHAHPPEFWQSQYSTLARGETWEGRIRTHRRDGAPMVQEVTIIPVQSDELWTLGVRRDITAQVRQRQLQRAQLRHASLHDPLTGLPNRTLLLDRLGQARARLEERRDGRYAVVFIDLDRFRVVNDSLGPGQADQLLLKVSERLRGVLRASDTLARLNGDEFVALLENWAPEAPWAVAERLRQAFEAPFELTTTSLTAPASLGLALGDQHKRPEDVLRDAERAMRRAKLAGGAQLISFDPSMARLFGDRLQREQSLRRAITQSHIQAWFQPQVRLADHRLVGFEALARWPSAPDRRPGEFIALAEETGLISALNAQIMSQTIDFASQVHERLDDAASQVTVGLNLSPLQLHQPSLVEDIQRCMEQHGLPAHRLEIEITETAAMRDPDRAARMCTQLRDLGLRLTIDDFGTGHSSLSQLHRLPVHRLKIDRSFVRDLGADEDSQAIVRTILKLARSMGLETVAEGVENHQQLRFLTEEGCNLVQGWLFSRGLTTEQALTYIDKTLTPQTP